MFFNERKKVFSGIIESTGHVKSVAEHSIAIESELFSSAKLGDSVALNGVCLTVSELQGTVSLFDVGSETKRRTTLQSLRVGSEVNLERALQLGERLHGHLVLGHVDGVSSLLEKVTEENTIKLTFTIPSGLEKYLAPKGSVALDGVSLTIGEASSSSFAVYIVPHTATVTTFGALESGDQVNIEIDCLARYAERILAYAD